MAFKKTIKQLFKYTVTTLLGTITDTVVLWVLTHHVFGDTHVEQYIISPLISFECAVFVNFLTAYFYVWKDRVNHEKPGAFLAWNIPIFVISDLNDHASGRTALKVHSSRQPCQAPRL